jgi:NAD(P)-dependent dehydrogenase (short-subunit alcohol dehydrogenase family)
MTKRAMIIGSKSDIAKGLMPMLEADEWELMTWCREDTHDDDYVFCPEAWNLLVCCVGSVAPVGLWHEVKTTAWLNGFSANVWLPFTTLRDAWPNHAPNASVCFLAGSNPQTIMPGYSAYNTGKMALLKLVEQLDAETLDAKFFALGPGIVLTKIHEASEGWNNPKLKAAQAAGKSTPINDIYDCLMWCVRQPKDIMGGRNICVSDWQKPDRTTLLYNLEQRPSLFKLRRVE